MVIEYFNMIQNLMFLGKKLKHMNFKILSNKMYINNFDLLFYEN